MDHRHIDSRKRSPTNPNTDNEDTNQTQQIKRTSASFLACSALRFVSSAIFLALASASFFAFSALA